MFLISNNKFGMLIEFTKKVILNVKSKNTTKEHFSNFLRFALAKMTIKAFKLYNFLSFKAQRLFVIKLKTTQCK